MKRLVCGSLLLCVLAAMPSRAGESPAPVTIADLAILANDVVIAHAGAVVGSEWTALWIDRVLKGDDLRGGRDIIWVRQREIPRAETNGKSWLLALNRLGDGTYHVANGGSDANLVTIENMQAPVVAQVIKAIGAYGPRPAPEALNGDVAEWIKRAARSETATRNEAMLKLLAAGESARPQLTAAGCGTDRDQAGVARTLLPLLEGGPVAGNMRLILGPATLALQPGDIRNLGVNYANLSAEEVQIVIGSSAWGANLLASASYELRALPVRKEGEQQPAAGAPIKAILPDDYGKAKQGGFTGLPMVRVVTAFGALPVAVDVELERVTLDGKEVRRLKLPNGHFMLPGPGRYGLRARFDCPGPRPDQPELSSGGYWRGGQLVSNEIVVVVK
ncbi:MAG TPA: hypothetical protein VGP72_19210 [Planctomycetota bacterium]|jgi:hypothetical protein